MILPTSCICSPNYFAYVCRRAQPIRPWKTDARDSISPWVPSYSFQKDLVGIVEALVACAALLRKETALNYSIADRFSPSAIHGR